MAGEINLTIRRANAADAAVIAAFNAALAAESEDLHLDHQRLAAGVRAVLEDASKGFYTVAEADGQVVGQMLITFEWSDWRNGVFWWIQSVYVSPGYRRCGVYARILQHVMQQAKALGNVCGFRLYVEKENTRAQTVYQHLGMRRTNYDMFEVDFVIER